MARAKRSRWLTELEALFIVKEEERRSEEWRRKLETMNKPDGRRRK